MGTRCQRERSRENRVFNSSGSGEGERDEERVYSWDVSSRSSIETGVGSLSAEDEGEDTEASGACAPMLLLTFAIDTRRFFPFDMI